MMNNIIQNNSAAVRQVFEKKTAFDPETLSTF